MWRTTCIFLFLVAAAGAGGDLSAEAPDEKSELKARLDQARQEVDEAVRKLADLLAERMEGSPERDFSGLFSLAPSAELGVIISGEDAEAGVLLEGVSKGSGADQAGLKAGDRLVTVDDVRLDEGNGYDALLDYMRTVKPDQEVALWVLRDGVKEQVTVIARPGPRHSLAERAEGILDGIDLDFDWDLDFEDLDGIEMMGRRVEAKRVPRLVDLDADLGAYFGVAQGVLVVNAPKDGDLRSGDVLIAVGGEAVTSARQARRLFSAAEEPVAVEVMRQRSKLSASIDPGTFPHHIGKRIRIIKLDEDESP